MIKSNRVPAYWPSSNTDNNNNNNPFLVVENLVIKYAPELPAVLHDVSFSLKAGERVGILGRTGSFCFFDVHLILVIDFFSSDRKWKIDVGHEHSQICELI